MHIAAFGVRKPVVANLVMFALLAGGLIFGIGLRREFFPEIRPTQVLVSAPYPGASPDEIEKSLAIKIEDRVADLDDVEEINSTCAEGVATVVIEFKEGVEIDAAVADVKREVDALQDLPEESERITVVKFEPNLPVIILSLYGDHDERAMKSALELLRQDLRSIPGMGDVTPGGTRVAEIAVEVRPERMLEHGLSLPMIASSVRAAMREVPGGTIKGSATNLTIRTMAADERAEDVRRIVVKATPGGQIVRLADVATVRETFADVDIRSRLNGKPAMSLTIFKTGDEDIVRMSQIVKAYAAGLRGEPLVMSGWDRVFGGGDLRSAYDKGVTRRAAGELPGDVLLTTDLARFVVGRLDLVKRNAFWGGILVFLTLVLLLNWRVSFWVAAGLIVSVMGTLVMMRFAGISLNLLSMFGLIIVIGILVDDAIVVSENIVTRHEGGEAPLEAAINGTSEVGWPVVGTVLTTIFSFLPLGLVQGNIGDFLEVLPLVVACALLVSLIESVFILPSHMGHSLLRAKVRHDRGKVRWIERVEEKFDAARERFFQGVLIPFYIRMLKPCMQHRYLTMMGFLAILIVSLGMVAGGRPAFVFFEVDDAETVDGQIRMPIGTPVGVTDGVVRRFEAAAMAQPEVTSVFALSGVLSDINGESVSSEQSHLGQIILELVPIEQRDRTSDEISRAIRDAVGPIAGVKSVRLEGVGGGPGGSPITLTVVGDRGGVIASVVEEVKARLSEYDGVYDVADDSDAGQREVRLTLRPGARELGFTEASLAEQVRGAVFGLEAYTFPGVREDVDVRVMLPEEVRRSRLALERMHVFTPDGRAVPLVEAAEIGEGEGYATIRRLDRRRAVTVTCELDEAVTSPEKVMESLRPELAKLSAAHPTVDILERGRQKEFAESMSTLPLGFLVAIGLNYVVLAWLFSSYTQPLLILVTVPFATIGMVWGHLLLGYNMTFLSLIGFVALSGVVVNDAIVFMEFYNLRRRDGLSVFDACVSAGRARVRAILLTTLTTFLGLMPLILEQSFQARFLIPMGITIAFGLVSATMLVLVALPALLLILDDVKRNARILWTGTTPDEWDDTAERELRRLQDVGRPSGASASH
ncbi:MAG: efflux RND transporter permease subunit [Phycisphaerales bacterium]|jgi:multidrug efflux pump subunit AcrB|nr:efflux RND transporter permease subunit [Phycisphaerales bacterium]